MGGPAWRRGVYFRALLIGYFEGLDSERGIAWRSADSLSLRKFLGYALDESTPDHSTISRTRRLYWVETHKAVFRWVLKILVGEGLLRGQTVLIDATTLEANVAGMSIVRRDNGQGYEEYLKELAQAAGMENPTREQLVRFDRKRKKKGSNQDWKSPSDPDARITKMKDGRTHLAHKVEHAVDLSTGALLAMTRLSVDDDVTTTIGQGLAGGDTGRRQRCSKAAGQRRKRGGGVTGERWRRNNKEKRFRSYIPEPERGRRNWQGEGKAAEQKQVYANRRRVRGDRSKRLQKLRSELTERSFAHLYETGGMRRVHLERAQRPSEATTGARRRVQSLVDPAKDAGSG